MELPNDLLVQLLRRMIEIRFFEDKLVDLYARGFAVGILHLSIGQEAVAVGTCANLRADDLLFSNHRGHGHYLAKGGDMSAAMAELFGKKTGCCKGKGGSMHIMDSKVGHMGATGIVGSGIPIAVGAALAAKLKQSKQVMVSFFGDGASNQGLFHEGLNFAALHKLPVLFVCENNLYAVSVSQKRSQAIENIADRSTSYNMPGVIVDGQDVIAVYQAAQTAVERALEGDGPTLIECKTYRWRGHHEGDPNRGARYRAKEEISKWKDRCPIKILKETLLESKIISETDIKEIESEITLMIEQAVDYALESPFPEPETLLTDVFAGQTV